MTLERLRKCRDLSILLNNVPREGILKGTKCSSGHLTQINNEKKVNIIYRLECKNASVFRDLKILVKYIKFPFMKEAGIEVSEIATII